MKSDFSPEEKRDYFDRGWIDGEEMAELVSEIIIEQCDKECKFDRPMFDSRYDGHRRWYLNRSNVIDKLRGLVEQRDHLVQLVASLFAQIGRQNENLNLQSNHIEWMETTQDLAIELIRHDMEEEE
tara:strand:+ start:316 stop:693 length:378 start_codon:yes stop_codon:yes gene_type:complete